MVSTVSDIQIEDVADYLRVDDYDKSNMASYLNIAKNYISSYTGIPITNDEEEGGESLDDFPDFVIVVYVLCQDMYDNRTMYVDKSNVNRVVQTILDMHTRNNL